MVGKTFDLTVKKTKKRFLFRVLIDAPFIRLLLLQQKRIIWTICAKRGFIFSGNTAVYIRIISQCKSVEQKYGGVHENRFRANLLLTIVYDKLHFCWHILPRNPYKIWVNTIVRHSYFLWCCETENTFKPFLIYSDAKRKCIGVANIHNNKMLLTIHRHIDNCSFLVHSFSRETRWLSTAKEVAQITLWILQQRVRHLPTHSRHRKILLYGNFFRWRVWINLWKFHLNVEREQLHSNVIQ